MAQKSLFKQPQLKSKLEHDYEQTLKQIRYAKKVWKKEKEERIKCLLWWTPELVNTLNLPADGRVWHIHPVALMANFTAQPGIATYHIDPRQKNGHSSPL